MKIGLFLRGFQGTIAEKRAYARRMQRRFLLSGIVLAGMATAACVQAQQVDEHSWQKSYPVAGRPTLIFQTSDASVSIKPCDCREIHIRAEVEGKKMSDYRVEE